MLLSKRTAVCERYALNERFKKGINELYVNTISENERIKMKKKSCEFKNVCNFFNQKVNDGKKEKKNKRSNRI